LYQKRWRLKQQQKLQYEVNPYFYHCINKTSLMHHQCLNCNHHFTGNFCNQCGQNKTVQRFTFSHIFSELFHAFTHADKGFLVLLKKILLYPGSVAYEYIEKGKRKKYFNLFTFFLIITAIAAFIESKELALKEQVFHENNEYGYLFNVYSKALTFITIPLLAFFIWLIHAAKRKLLLSEYTVFAMVLMTLRSIAEILTKTVNYFRVLITKSYTELDGSLFFAGFLVLYIAYANYQFHKELKGSNWLLSLLTGFVFIAVNIGLYMFIVFAVINKFKGLGIFSMYGIRLS
jgi:Protein of unknown function (DUF3667)